MAGLTRAAALALTLSSPAASTAAPGDPVARWHAEIAVAAARTRLQERWIAAVMRAESGGRAVVDGHPITSRVGAMGLMQLMPATWAMLRAQLALGSDPYDPADNILAGAFYLRMLYDRFGFPGLFAAYNAGPARYQAAFNRQEPLPSETRAYVAKLAASLPAKGTPPATVTAPPSLFALTEKGSPLAPDSTGPRHDPPASDPLFAVRKRP